MGSLDFHRKYQFRQSKNDEKQELLFFNQDKEEHMFDFIYTIFPKMGFPHKSIHVFSKITYPVGCQI